MIAVDVNAPVDCGKRKKMMFGMATKFGEATLAVKYRVKAKDGSFIGGPMYALE